MGKKGEGSVIVAYSDELKALDISELKAKLVRITKGMNSAQIEIYRKSNQVQFEWLT